MKKVIVFMFILAGMILNVSWMLQGCTGKIPTLSAIVATSTPTLGPQWVANFESGTGIINANLINSNSGNFNVLPSGNFVNSPGANGTAFSPNIFVAPKVLSGYAPYELEANPNASGVYNLQGTSYAAASNGIQFYWKTGPTDNMPARWFIAPVPPQIPPAVGTCPGTGGGCYDTFKVPLGGTANSWQLVQVAWGSMNQAGWGFPQVGNLATGSY